METSRAAMLVSILILRALDNFYERAHVSNMFKTTARTIQCDCVVTAAACSADKRLSALVSAFQRSSFLFSAFQCFSLDGVVRQLNV